jgi:triacylglycerol lipase
MRRMILPALMASLALTEGSDASDAVRPQNDDCVILLHGLSRTPRSMLAVEWFLEAKGYQVVNKGYPSTKKNVETLAEETLPEALEACSGFGKVHFVTHSMGGILLRHYLANHKVERLGRAVMMAPPNGGSEIVDKFGDLAFFEALNGPAGQELGTGEQSLTRRLGRITFEAGVIAGTRSLNPLTSSMVEGQDDGKVSVASALSAGSSDHLILPVSHTFMMLDPEVLRATYHFIQHGQFQEKTNQISL